MFVQRSAARGALLLAGVVTVSLYAWGPALAENHDIAAPSDPGLEGNLQTSEANPGRLRDAPTGTPNRSLWRSPSSPARLYRMPDAPDPALDKPLPLLGGLFESSETTVFPHP